MDNLKYKKKIKIYLNKGKKLKNKINLNFKKQNLIYKN